MACGYCVRTEGAKKLLYAVRNLQAVLNGMAGNRMPHLQEAFEATLYFCSFQKEVAP